MTKKKPANLAKAWPDKLVACVPPLFHYIHVLLIMYWEYLYLLLVLL